MVPIMAESYLPSYPTTRPHHAPEYGQASVYVYDDGDEYPCMIHQVFASSPDGKYYNVAVSIVWPPHVGPDGITHPGKSIRDGHVYWKEGELAGKIGPTPCGPPFPG